MYRLGAGARLPVSADIGRAVKLMHWMGGLATALALGALWIKGRRRTR
jgi:hypothetical protein